ncbi:MAG: hypothetical protein HFJ41_05880 [Clostridia bacterium]|nr:hypothetical protein [Clostridia bacterium]
MKEDSSIPIANNSYIESVKNLVSNIRLLESQIKELEKTLQDMKREKQDFDSTWQKKCNHPEFFKITIAEERIPSAGNKNSKYYSLTKGMIERGLLDGTVNPHPEMIFCRCSICGLEVREIESVEYVKELEIKRIKHYCNIDFKPISDIATNLYHKKIEEFASLEKQIEDLNLKLKRLQEELERLKKEAEEIAEILNSELGIKHTEYIYCYPFIDPIYSDRLKD